mmetsp:Transcript_28590/g.55952  ORF Transcript_28590/g.55952 Transcript_28590/m.55952 type:complete len:947 (+) Transcript_28590:92-2932(+)
MSSEQQLSGAKWKELLGPSAASDLELAVQNVSWAIDELLEEESDVSATTAAAAAEAAAVAAAKGPVSGARGWDGLMPALSSALQSSLEQRALLGCLTILAFLESEVYPAALPRLACDATFAGLSCSLQAGSPVVVAAAMQSLCGLLGGMQAASVKEARQDKNARSRKVGSQLRAILDSHPKSPVVHEAFATGCAALLVGEGLTLGGNLNLLWTALWPLTVHPRETTAHAAMLGICRLTWFAKPPQSGSSGSSARGLATEQQVPGAEEALVTACNEFELVFKPVRASVASVGPAGSRPPVAAGPSRMARLQCLRLLGLMRGLLRFGRSPMQSHGRHGRSGTVDAAIVTIPVARLVSTIDSVLSGLLQVVGAGGRGLVAVLTGALQLAADLADTAGSALLPYASRVRRWLELLTERSLADEDAQWQRCVPTCGLLMALVRSAPALLLKQLLLQRLLRYCGSAMRPASQSITRSLSDGSSVAKASRARKRKAGQAFNVTASSVAGPSLPAMEAAFSCACATLAGLLEIAAPMVAQSEVAEICEQVVRVLWLGLLAPDPDQASLVQESMSEVIACQRLCRDAQSMLSLLGVMEALHQRPKLGVTPLAPSLRDAFAALLNSLASAYARRSTAQLPGKGGCTSRDGSESFASASAVSLKSLQIKDALLAISWSTLSTASGSNDRSGSGVSISWPEPLAVPIAGLPAADATDAQDVIESLGTKAPAAADVEHPPAPAVPRLHDASEVAAVASGGGGSSHAEPDKRGAAVDDSTNAVEQSKTAASERHVIGEKPTVESTSGAVQPDPPLVQAPQSEAATADMSGTTITDKVDLKANHTNDGVLAGDALPGSVNSENVGDAPAAVAISVLVASNEDTPVHTVVVKQLDDQEETNNQADLGIAAVGDSSVDAAKVTATTPVVDAAPDAAAAPLELFEGSDGSPVPELCMDSPSGDD